MKPLTISTIVRWILSIGLLWGVFSESGFYTTLTVFLLIVAMELQSRINDQLKELIVGLMNKR